MLELNRQAGDRGLYFGRTLVVDSAGKPRPEWNKPRLGGPWAPVNLEDVLYVAPFSFPGQLFQVSCAKELGKFRETSQFAGEWELWSKIIAHYRAAQTDTGVAVFRDHRSWDRGTTRIYRSGKTLGLTAVQCKRNVALAKRVGILPPHARYTRAQRTPVPTTYLLYYAKYFSPLYLSYNATRYVSVPAPNWRYALLQAIVRLGGPSLIKLASRVWTLIRSPH